jgi:hypothetical protein
LKAYSSTPRARVMQAASAIRVVVGRGTSCAGRRGRPCRPLTLCTRSVHSVCRLPEHRARNGVRSHGTRASPRMPSGQEPARKPGIRGAGGSPSLLHGSLDVAAGRGAVAPPGRRCCSRCSFHEVEAVGGNPLGVRRRAVQPRTVATSAADARGRPPG